uniref:Uncharacterized protein n=1 Tax=Quercus lobata TaxID=97700 RepID=A0A7N2R3V0_QUELO
MKGTVLIFASSPLQNGGCSDEICLWEEEDNIICLLKATEKIASPRLWALYCGNNRRKQSLEGSKHRKSLADTAIAKDLVQLETMYGRLDAHLDLEVIPCEIRPGIAWTMSLIPCWLKCWMSANGARLYQWNSLFCFHLCSLPSLVSFGGVIGFQNSSSLPAYGFKGNSTPIIFFDMELPGLHLYVLVGLLGFSPCPVTYALWHLHIKFIEEWRMFWRVVYGKMKTIEVAHFFWACVQGRRFHTVPAGTAEISVPVASPVAKHFDFVPVYIPTIPELFWPYRDKYRISAVNDGTRALLRL